VHVSGIERAARSQEVINATRGGADDSTRREEEVLSATGIIHRNSGTWSIIKITPNRSRCLWGYSGDFDGALKKGMEASAVEFVKQGAEIYGKSDLHTSLDIFMKEWTMLVIRHGPVAQAAFPGIPRIPRGHRVRVQPKVVSMLDYRRGFGWTKLVRV
jgi:hypothetical protein